jgi:hypothetical protein
MSTLRRFLWPFFWLFFFMCGGPAWGQSSSVVVMGPGVLISQLPAATAGNANIVFMVRDGATATDCTTGGGTKTVYCVSNGTSWGYVTGVPAGTGVVGNADTASQLFADGGNCGVNNASRGVDTFGAAQGCFAVVPQATFDTHVADTAAHGATSAGTPSRIVAANSTGKIPSSLILSDQPGGFPTLDAATLLSNLVIPPSQDTRFGGVTSEKCGTGEAVRGFNNGHPDCVPATGGSGGGGPADWNTLDNKPPINGPNGLAGLDADALLLLSTIPPDHAHMVTLGAPNIGACDRDGMLFTSTGLQKAYDCPNGPGGNAIDIASLGDSFTTLCGDVGCATATLQDQFNFIFSGTGFIATVTQGPPKTVSVTLANPIKTYWIPASNFSPDGVVCAVPDESTLNTSRPKSWSITCTDNDAGTMETDIGMPNNWDGGPVKVRYYVYSTTAQTTAVAYSTSGQCVRNQDAIAAVATTGEVTTSLTFTNVANQELNVLSTAITLQGTCAANAHVYLHTDVDATGTSNSTDMTRVRFKGIRLEYGITGAGEAP